MREDWYTARVVAMLAAVNSKRGRYEPVKYMMKFQSPSRRGTEASTREEKDNPLRQSEGMTGEQIIQRFRQLGMPIIDLRAKKTEVN